MTKASKNETNELLSVLLVNLILLWKLLNVNNVVFLEFSFKKQMMLFTYLFHILILFFSRGLMVFSTCTVKIFTGTGPNGEPIAAQ